jgi:DNA end-binding protein Ku
MEHSGLAGVAKFVMRDRQNLGALRVRDGVIVLEQMYFADEIRPLDEIKPRKAAVSKDELGMAEQLIDNFAADFEPKKYKDTYRNALCEIIRAKRAGKEVHRAPDEGEETSPPDLLQALRASIEAAGGNGRANPKGPSGTARVTICLDCRKPSSTSAPARRRSPAARRCRSASSSRR